MKISLTILAYMLTTLFVGLRLTGHIDWHWIWVAAPVWVDWVVRFAVGFAIGFAVTSRRNRQE